MRIPAIAANTFREAVRNRMMHTILGLALAVIMCSKALAWVSAGEDLKVMTDLGLAAIVLFGVIVALFSGANLLHKEVEKKTSYLILTKPLARYEFILGKYFGLTLVLLACAAIMSAVHAGYLTTLLFSVEGRAHGAIVRSYYIALTQAYFLIFLELCVISAFAVFFSSISSPVFSAVATFGIFFIGHGLRNLDALSGTIESASTRFLLQTAYKILPALFLFDMKHQAAYADPEGVLDILLRVAYAAAYCAAILAVTCTVFRRKQL